MYIEGACGCSFDIIVFHCDWITKYLYKKIKAIFVYHLLLLLIFDVVHVPFTSSDKPKANVHICRFCQYMSRF
jgi:hypothetical protein